MSKYSKPKITSIVYDKNAENDYNKLYKSAKTKAIKLMGNRYKLIEKYDNKPESRSKITKIYEKMKKHPYYTALGVAGIPIIAYGATKAFSDVFITQKINASNDPKQIADIFTTPTLTRIQSNPSLKNNVVNILSNKLYSSPELKRSLKEPRFLNFRNRIRFVIPEIASLLQN